MCPLVSGWASATVLTFCPTDGGSLVADDMESPDSTPQSTSIIRRPRGWAGIILIISIVVIVATEAGAAFLAAAWGLVGLGHLPFPAQVVLYGIAAAATLAVTVYAFRRALESDDDNDE